jgi:hypothetical protein
MYAEPYMCDASIGIGPATRYRSNFLPMLVSLVSGGPSPKQIPLVAMRWLVPTLARLCNQQERIL